MIKHEDIAELGKSQPELLERIADVHEYWSSLSYDEVVSKMPKGQSYEAGSRAVSAVVIPPRTSDTDETRTIVRMAEHMQPLTVGQYMSAAILRDVVAPQSRVVMLQNNSRTQDEHLVDFALRRDILGRGLLPLAEDKVRALEKMNLGKLDITGWSLGARLAINMAAAGSNTLDIAHVNADEPPSAQSRGTLGLMSDFPASGAKKEQLDAVADADMPAFSEHFDPNALRIDYLKFGMFTFLPTNALIMRAMRGSMESEIIQARRSSPNTYIKLGSVEGSKLFTDMATSAHLVDRAIVYNPRYRHASVNQPFVQAMMANDGLNPRDS